jgi:hypothetical protein
MQPRYPAITIAILCYDIADGKRDFSVLKEIFIVHARHFPKAIHLEAADIMRRLPTHAKDIEKLLLLI